VGPRAALLWRKAVGKRLEHSLERRHPQLSRCNLKSAPNDLILQFVKR